MNFKELKQLILLVDEKEFVEFELEQGDFKLRIKRHHAPIIQAPPVPVMVHNPAAAPALDPGLTQPPPSNATAPGTALVEPPPEPEKLHTITSPLVGTFYRSPSPTANPFVRVGDHIGPGMPLCIIEAMKLMNEIVSDVAGEIVQIHVENGQPVEYGQPLFGIRRGGQ
jgi:acetyl-CoA carboxylase biotin carboxyl carrier protein